MQQTRRLKPWSFPKSLLLVGVLVALLSACDNGELDATEADHTRHLQQEGNAGLMMPPEVWAKLSQPSGAIITPRSRQTREYMLPFREGVKTYVFQGYWGNFSHRNERAIDFNVQGNNIDVLAARAGTVSWTQHFDANTWSGGCRAGLANRGNSVVIDHGDGTSSIYMHLSSRPSVNSGERVAQGQRLGSMGNTGCSSGPHLHFSAQNNQTRQTIPTPFVEIEGYGIPQLRHTYRSQNNLGNTPEAARPPVNPVNPPQSEGGQVVETSPSNEGRQIIHSPHWYVQSASSQRSQLIVQASHEHFAGWDFIAPDQDGNSGWMIRLRGSQLCINAHYLYSYAPVNVWRCNSLDPDQQFVFVNKGEQRLIRRLGSAYCLNAAEKRQGGRVTLWPCNASDPDQIFQIP